MYIFFNNHAYYNILYFDITSCYGEGLANTITNIGNYNVDIYYI